LRLLLLSGMLVLVALASLGDLAAGMSSGDSPGAPSPMPAEHAAPPVAGTVDPALPLSSATSLLVIAPHPDDESLCCAGVIQRVVRLGGRVSVLWVTNGDASELDLLVIEKRVFIDPVKMRDLGDRRMQEARNATAILGVAPESQYFLGYPDRGILSLATDNYATPYRSRFTNATSVPYRAALFPGHSYTGQSLESDFGSVLDRVQPTLILAPTPRDSHPDHRATGIMILRVLNRRHELARARYWIVHGGEGWPAPKGFEPGMAMTPAPLQAGLSPTPFVLESIEEQRKLLAIRAYRTQMIVMSTNLLSFVRTNELFSSLPVPWGTVD